jgi:hypothetical protein
MACNAAFTKTIADVKAISPKQVKPMFIPMCSWDTEGDAAAERYIQTILWSTVVSFVMNVILFILFIAVDGYVYLNGVIQAPLYGFLSMWCANYVIFEAPAILCLESKFVMALWTLGAFITVIYDVINLTTGIGYITLYDVGFFLIISALLSLMFHVPMLCAAIKTTKHMFDNGNAKVAPSG